MTAKNGKLACHPYNLYELSYMTTNFEAMLPHLCLPMTSGFYLLIYFNFLTNTITLYNDLFYNIGIAPYLLGLTDWQSFVTSSLCKRIFDSFTDEKAQQQLIEDCMQDCWTEFVNYLQHYGTCVEEHKTHSTLVATCYFCSKFTTMSLEQWWHTSDAARHVYNNCTCIKCKQCSTWGARSTKGGCYCPKCKPFREKYNY